MKFIVLFLVGIVAGFQNTLAGGGSILVLPILVIMGIPSPIANATNRVAILIQNMTGVSRFHHHKQLKITSIKHIAIASIIGAIGGSLLVVKMSSSAFDKILGIFLIGLLFLMFRPHKSKNRFTKQLPTWLEFIIFLIIGFYGGFIQAGIGFILLATLNLVEEFNLIEANAVKVFIVMCYTLFAVIIFALSGKILWKYGLILAMGNSIGAWIGVHSAVKKGEKLIRVVLILAVLIACLKLFGIFKLIGY